MRRFSNVRAILVGFGILLAGRTASAQDQPPPAPEPELEPQPQPQPRQLPPPDWFESPRPSPSVPVPPESGSYGAQIVFADLGAILVGALVSNQSDSAIPILATWSLASPLVHAAHGHPGRGLLSLLLHVGAPIVGGYVGVQLEDCSHSSSDEGFCGLAGLALGGLVGMVTATTIDAAVLAQPADEPPPPRPAYGRGIASAPALSVSHRGDVTFGWRGTF